MHSFKPLLQDGLIEEQPVNNSIAPDSQTRLFELPDFTAPGAGDNPDQTYQETEQVRAYEPPDMTDTREAPEELYVRKYADAKNRVFLPLLTIEPDEEPAEAARRQAENILREAETLAQEMRGQGTAELQQAQENAARITQEAEQYHLEAKTTLESARAEVPAIHKTAQEEGFNSGYQDGMEQGMTAGTARLEALLADFSQAAKNVAKARDDVLRALNPEIVALVEACLDKIFLAANSVDAALVAQVVDHAISRLDESSHITVRLNPLNLEHIPKLAPDLWTKMQSIAKISWLPDPALRPGDCIIDTPINQVDATVQTRRQRIFAQLEDSLQQGQPLDLEAILAEAAQRRAREPEPPAQPEASAASATSDGGTPVQPETPAADPWDEDNLDDEW